MNRGLGQVAACMGILVAGSLRAADFSFGFDGCPAQIRGLVGQVKSFEVFVTLTSENIEGIDGAQGWSLSIEAAGGRIEAISLDGIKVDTYYEEDHDSNPSTPPVIHEHYEEDLGSKAVFFKVALLATKSDEPTREGAISALVFRSREKMTLQRSGTHRIAKLTVSAQVPSEVVLHFVNGFQAPPYQPVNNVVTYMGQSFQPFLGTCLVQLLSLADATPPFVRGDPNDDGKMDIADAVWIFNELFLGERATACAAASDSNGDGQRNMSDGLYVIQYEFLGGRPPDPPFPNCSPSSSEADRLLGCESPPGACR